MPRAWNSPLRSEQMIFCGWLSRSRYLLRSPSSTAVALHGSLAMPKRAAIPVPRLFLLVWLCGPVAAIIWLYVRPRTMLVDRPVDDYANADDAIAAASKLDMLGDWDEAVAPVPGMPPRTCA